jgi:hypothetical protein
MKKSNSGPMASDDPMTAKKVRENAEKGRSTPETI